MFLNIERKMPALWYFDTLVTYRQWFCGVKLVAIPPHFVRQQYLWNIAIQTAVGCYNSWANVRCSGCSPLGEKLLWNRTIGYDPSRASRIYNSDVILGSMASQITSVSIVCSTVCSVQSQIKENFKAPRHWPLCGEFTGDRWIPRTKGQ